MKESEAHRLLKNLLDRLDADAEAERPLFRGVVSDAERGALRAVLGVSGGAPPRSAAEPVAPAEPVAGTSEEGSAETPVAAVELNTDALRLDASPAPEWVLCLDFGTAKSKAFAATDDEEQPELEPLPVGSADDDLDGSVHEVSSCVWIDDDGRLFVGSEAVKLGMNHGAERRPLASLKQEISQVDPEDGQAELARKLPVDVDPTSTLTCADVIAIYLAYLTDLATTALESRVGTRYVRRRFTVPSWRPPQRRWAADLLGKCLLRAQLLADTFHGRWRDGIPVEQVAHAVRAAAGHDGELTWMAAAESDDRADWTQGRLEALAAASARLWNDGSARNLMLVVDVGAGTTDLSLFWVVQREAKFYRAWPVAGADAGIRQAGDTLDRLLVEALLRKAGLGPDETGDRARRGLRRKGVRRLKEELFRTGSVTEILVNDETVTLSREEFIGSEGVRRFSERIAGKIQQLLDGVHSSWGRAVDARGLTLVLTGGGCDLPMITGLKDRPWRLGERTVDCRLAPRVPPGLAAEFSEDFIGAYPRLAVAMGGALKMRLDEKDAMKEWMGGTPRSGRLERFPTKGA